MALVTEYSALIVAVVAGIGALGWLVRKVAYVVRMMEAVAYEVKPNAGNSMRDQITRIEAKQSVHAAAIAAHAAALVAAGLLMEENQSGTDAHT